MKELYINKQRCDLDDKVAFALQFKSPIMAKQDYLLQNRTSTIKLPATANNRRIFGFIDKVEAISQIPYRKHIADYYADGQQIVKGGQATILSVSSSEIELSIAWGFSLVFTELFNKNLKELAIPNSFYWGSSTPIGGTPTDIYMPYCLPYGNDASKHNPWVKESFIVDKILGEYGRGVADYGAYIYLPTRQKENIGLSGEMESQIYASYGLTPILTVDNLTTNGIEFDDTDVFCYSSLTPRYGVEFTVGIADAENSNGVRAIEVSSIDAQGNVEQVGYYEAEPYDEYGYVGYPPQLTIYGVDMLPNKRYRVRAASSYDTYSAWTLSINIGGGATVSFNSYFPIAINLPDMTCGEFIKSYMQRHNLFYDVDTEGVISFIRIDDIFAKIDNGEILDWSDKVQSIEAVDFTIGEFAQRNICTYKDEQEGYNASGVFAVDSELLGKEGTFVECELMPPPQTTGVVTIDHYSDGGVFKALDADTAYVCNVVEGDVDGSTTNIASFTLGDHAQTFDILIEDYFTDYVAVVNQPKVFTARLHLTNNDIANIKYNQPIYIRQTGQYCLIQTIDVRDNGVTGTFVVIPHSITAAEPEPPQQGWVAGTDITPGRAAAVSAAYNGELYVMAGFTGTVNTLSSLTQSYNPATRTWTSRANVLTQRHSAGGGVIDDIIYMGGGRVGSTPLNNLEGYDCLSDTWSSYPSMSTAVSECAGTTVGNKLFILGGRASYGNPYNLIQVYNADTMSWSSSNNMAIARRNFYATNFNGQIAIAGGYTAGGGTADFELYDPSTLTYTSLWMLPLERWDNAIAATEQYIYTIGGESPDGRLSEFLYYDPDMDIWEMLDTPTEALSKAILTNVNGAIILVGGDNGTTTYTQTQIYYP